MDDLKPDYAPALGVSRGWCITFIMLGAFVALDGAWTLLAGNPGIAATVESLGKTLAGPLLAVHGARGLRNGRGLQGPGVTLCAALGACMYFGGMVAGSA